MVNYVSTIYSSGGTLRVRWRANTTGNAVFRTDWSSPATGAYYDPVPAVGSQVISTSTGSNAINTFTTDIASGLTRDDIINLRLWRLGASASDTIASTVDVLDVILETTPLA
jgi:hypothetical protein